MIMTVSSWRNAVLASLLTSEASVAGQQLVLVALSSSPPSSTTDDGSSYEAEPPCRQRRLEPWRQQVRARCFVDAVNRCPVEQRDLRREGHGDTYVPLRSSSSLASTLFGDLFQEAAIKDDADDDPLDELFNRMMGFSLRAFDQKIIGDEQPASHQEEKEEEEEEAFGSDKSFDPLLETPEEEEAEAGEEEYVDDDDQSFDELESVLLLESPEEEEAEAGEDEYVDDDDDDDDLWFPEDAEYVASASTPEQAAENALDIMVASFAELTVASSAEVKEVDDAATSKETHEEEEETPSFLPLPLPPAVDLPRLLAQRGDALLAAGAASAARRRLAEGDAAEDPRARVAARLARRLTEYRADLLFAPDGRVVLYTANFRPVVVPPPGEAAPPALGMGSRPLDECVRSSFQNRDLSGGCHRAVGKFLLAVDHGSPASPHHREFGAATAPAEEEGGFWLVAAGMAIVLTLGLLFCVCMTMVESYLGIEDMDEDWVEEEEVGGFNYAALPDGVSRAGRPLGKPRVFVGVPVQVV